VSRVYDKLSCTRLQNYTIGASLHSTEPQSFAKQILSKNLRQYAASYTSQLRQ